MRLLCYFFIMCLSSMVLSSCCDEQCENPEDPSCINYDPCYNVSSPSAEFTASDRVFTGPNFAEFIEVDSVLIGTLVQFSAVSQGEDITHTWYVGADTLEGESILRSFPYPQVQRPLTLTVTHVIEFPEDETCYPGITSDSVTHSFYVIEYYEETKVLNQWMRLAPESSTDSIDVIFRYLLDDGSLAPYGYTGSKSVDLYLINFFSSGDTTIIPRGEVGVIDHSLFFRNSIGGLNGYLSIDSNNNVDCKYRTNQNEFSFNGRLIQ